MLLLATRLGGWPALLGAMIGLLLARQVVIGLPGKPA
jgi:hypothetical protein